MASDIESYLRELQTALSASGADPALTQDALFDAEEYLRAAMAVGGSAGRGTATYEARFAAATRGYGSPEEVAAAYLGMPVSAGRFAPAAVGVGAAAFGAPAVEAPPAAEAPSAAGTTPVIGEAMTYEPASATEVTTESHAEAARVCGRCGAELRPAARFCTACGAPVAEPTPEATAIREAPQTGPGAPPYAPLPAGVQAGMVAAGTAAAAAAAARPSIWQQIFGVFADAAVWKSLLYMIVSLATGIVYFTVVVTGVSTAAGMSVLIIGVPLFVLVLGIVRAMALFEGRVVEVLLGTRMPRRPRAEPPDVGFFQRLWFWIKDGRTWASMGYMVLMLPLGCIYFTIAVTGLATGIGLIASPLWGWAGDYTFIYEGVTYSGWFPAWGIPLAMILGAVVLVVFMHVVKWIGRGHAAFAKAMLVRLSK